MHTSSLDSFVLEDANTYIQSTSEVDRAKILAHMALLRAGDHEILHTKQLSGQVRELIVKQHRIVYFVKNQILYFVNAFKKQSTKTPKRILDHAKKIYKSI